MSSVHREEAMRRGRVLALLMKSWSGRQSLSLQQRGQLVRLMNREMSAINGHTRVVAKASSTLR